MPAQFFNNCFSTKWARPQFHQALGKMRHDWQRYHECRKQRSLLRSWWLEPCWWWLGKEERADHQLRSSLAGSTWSISMKNAFLQTFAVFVLGTMFKLINLLRRSPFIGMWFDATHRRPLLYGIVLASSNVWVIHAMWRMFSSTSSNSNCMSFSPSYASNNVSSSYCHGLYLQKTTLSIFSPH